MTDKKHKKRKYRRPALKYEQEIQAVGGLCIPEFGNFQKGEGQVNTFDQPCTSVFT